MVFLSVLALALIALQMQTTAAKILLVDDFNLADNTPLTGTTPRIGNIWVEKDDDTSSQSDLLVVNGHLKTTHVSSNRNRGAGAGFTPAAPGETLFVGFSVEVTSSANGCAEFLALFDGVTDSPLRVHFAYDGNKIAFGLHPTSEQCQNSPVDSPVTALINQQVSIVVSYNKVTGVTGLFVNPSTESLVPDITRNSFAGQDINQVRFRQTKHRTSGASATFVDHVVVATSIEEAVKSVEQTHVHGTDLTLRVCVDDGRLSVGACAAAPARKRISTTGAQRVDVSAFVPYIKDGRNEHYCSPTTKLFVDNRLYWRSNDLIPVPRTGTLTPSARVDLLDGTHDIEVKVTHSSGCKSSRLVVKAPSVDVIKVVDIFPADLRDTSIPDVDYSSTSSSSSSSSSK